MVNETFSEWLSAEVEKRGWSFRELSRRSGLSSSAISQVVTGVTLPGLKFCYGVARGLQMQPEVIMSKAGLIPTPPEESEIVSEIVYIINRLSPEDQVRILVQTRALRDLSEREGYTVRESGS
jgi:transcriptional regulator with XRE-family HTH domain